jgi:hypothetical protein
MARDLLRSGWEYVVVDIQRYETRSKVFDYRRREDLGNSRGSPRPRSSSTTPASTGSATKTP